MPKDDSTTDQDTTTAEVTAEVTVTGHGHKGASGAATCEVSIDS